VVYGETEMGYHDAKTKRVPILPVGLGNIVGDYSDKRTHIHGKLWKPADKQYVQLILDNPLAAEPGEQPLRTEMYVTQAYVYEVGDNALCAVIEADFPDELNPYWFFTPDHSQDFSDETKDINRGMSGLLRILANSSHAQHKGSVRSVSEAKDKALSLHRSTKKNYLTAVFQKKPTSCTDREAS
jgi:hypothetical protein